MNVRIERLNDTGDGVGNYSGKIIFVPKTVFGDLVDVYDYLEYKKYMIATKYDIIEYSSDRIDLKCPYFDMCGGCQIMNLSYDKQIIYKKNKVVLMFKKYANIDINPEIIGTSQFNYRNKIILEVKDGKLGLYKYHSHDIICINECLLAISSINMIIKLINDNCNLFLVNRIMIRTSFDNSIMVSFYGNIKYGDLDFLKDRVNSIYINDELVYGKDRIITRLGKYMFEISNNSFFQVNYEQMIRLYDKVYEYLPSGGKVMDLYCGTGSIGIYVSSKCSSVLGVEINESAVEDANRNKILNNISNIDFICGDVSLVIDENNYFDSIIVDPPRAGLSTKTKDILLKICSNNIIYVSCNPMTLVRDIKDLNCKYYVKDITLFDMFPNTYHCESIVLLKLK